LILFFHSFAFAEEWGKCWFPTERSDVVCANISVPLNWNKPEQSDSIYITASKFPTNQPRRGTIFYLNGGSGIGTKCFGISDDAGAKIYNALGFDLIYPDFRGAGESTPRIFCPDDPNDQQTPSIECAKYLNETYGPSGMYMYSVSAASRDLNHMMLTLLEQGEQVLLQGDSFGTFWLQRFAVMYSQLKWEEKHHYQLGRSVAESFGVYGVFNYWNALENIDWVGSRILAKCSKDPFCANQLGYPNAPLGLDWGWTWRTMLNNVSGVECTQKLPSYMNPDNDWRRALLTLVGGLISADRNTFPFVPATINRLLRCNEEDIEALQHLFKWESGNLLTQKRNEVMQQHLVENSGQKKEVITRKTAERDPCAISQIILYNLFFTEGVTNVKSIATLEKEQDELLFSAPVDILVSTRKVFNYWPRYELDEFAKQSPADNLEVLYINGDLDISTPLAGGSTITYLTSHSLIVLNSAPHVAFLQSPVNNSPLPCGIQLIASYFNGTLNENCLNHLLPLDWSLQSEKSKAYSMALFGTENGW